MAATRATIQRSLRDPESFGTTLLLAVAAAYGLEPLAEGWEPAVLWRQVKDDFEVELDGSAFGRLMAATAVLESDRFFANLPDFLDLANALNGAGLDPEAFDPVSVDEAAWAVSEALLLTSFLDADPPTISPDVAGYLEMQLAEEGMLRPPDVLASIVGHDLDRVGRVLGEFASDPALHEMLHRAEEEKVDAVSKGVRDRLALLVDQLANLLDETHEEIVEGLRRG